MYLINRKILVKNRPFGMAMSNRKFTQTSSSYRYGFNGKEKDKEINADDYDFGERVYDSRLGKFLSIDKFAQKYPFNTPYSFANNCPISVIDVKGDSLYFLFYTTGNQRGDEMFQAAALTRKTDIERSKTFDAKRDKVVLLEMKDMAAIKTQVEKQLKENALYGPTVELGIWSHAGIDGPTGTSITSTDGKDKKQMSMAGWSKINFNWANGGEGCRAGFYGCNTSEQSSKPDGFGLGPYGGYPNSKSIEGSSFTEKISALSNFKHVTVSGQTTYSFPSQFTDYRINSEASKDKFITKVTPTVVHFQRTYLVGGEHSYRGLNSTASQHIVNNMRFAKNGNTQSLGVQQGDKKPKKP
jgi:RHS repeat-associated protein